MWERSDNQDVGLEAATIERKRNSSLVKRARADNVTGLKHFTEAVGNSSQCSEVRGQERKVRKKEELICEICALITVSVGEHSVGR